MKQLRKTCKKSVSILLSAVMIISLFTIVPFTAYAETVSMTELTGSYTAEGNIEVNNRIACNGDVTLTLAEGATMTVHGGISVTEDASLTINGTGTLVIDNVDYGNAGIGGGEDESLSELTVNGGTITVEGGIGGAGIGGGKGGFVGKVNINGGAVTAQGGESAAGIGTGNLTDTESIGFSDDDEINITGGTVTASGGSKGAGIGEGEIVAETEEAETAAITIEGGTVNAHADYGSDDRGKASIGGSGCTVAVLGGNVTAENGGIYSCSGESIVLSWKRTSDSIYSYDYIGSGTVVFEKRFKIQGTDTYFAPGDYSEENAAFDNKTLVPPYDGWIDNVDYIDENGVRQTVSRAIALDESMTELPSGWFTVGGEDALETSPDISDRIVCTGDVNLILCDYSTLNALGGITVAEGSSLTIYAQSGYDPDAENNLLGKLICGNGNVNGNASIGGESGQNSGDITIVGGSITAVGKENGAGIGGDGGSGTVTVNCSEAYPAYVNATGGYYAAGIGGGQNGGGNVKIYGGYVTAAGGTRGAGIGGGRYGSGNVEIYGGNISATGGNKGAAGIGGGEEGSGSVTVSGGTVVANSNASGGGAGIGGGYNNVGIVNISGGNITANTHSSGAGIGGGRGGNDSLVTISGGEVHAVSTDAGAAIGGGFKTKGNVIINGGTVTASVSSSVTYGPAGIGGGNGGAGEVTITDGTVTATGGSGGAGIGGGREKAGNIEISGGTITKSIGGNGGAGVGGGAYGAGIVTISGGNITEAKSNTTNNNGGAGIGGGNSGKGTVNISGGTVTSAVGGTYGAGIGGGYEAAGEIEISGGTIAEAQGGYNAAGIGGGTGAAGSVTISGGNVSATGGYSASGIGSGYNASTDSTIDLSWTNQDDSIYASSYGGTVTLEKAFKNKDNDTEVFTPGVASASDLANKTIVPYIAYTVTWNNYDGTTLETVSVALGESPSYDGETPVKPGSGNTSYVFKGWTDGETYYAANDTLPAVTGDITYTAEFTESQYVAQVEPYIDENGEYHLGNVAYYVIDGKYYSVGVNGEVGGELGEDEIPLSYFDFKLINNNNEYQINYYTGPTDDLSELVIPKTFNGKPITILGSSYQETLINYEGKTKTQFELTLNENIREIKKYTFFTLWVTKVKGNTSNLSTIGEYAFSWANSPGGYTLDMQLDYEGRITPGTGMFNNMNVTLRLKHATKLIDVNLNAQSITYIFTDTHIYGDNPSPAWTWESDYSGAAATFTCTDSRCRHEEPVQANITSATENGIITYTATAEFEGKTYTDVKTAFADGIGAELVGYSLSLDGDIGVNFYMDLSAEIANSSTAYMEFEIPGNTTTVQRVYVNDQNDPSKAFARQKTVEGYDKIYYVFKCRVAAKEMTSQIKARMYESEGGKTGDQYTYSVKDYADYLLAHTANNPTFLEAAELVKKMLNYGAYAQRYFDKNPTDLANDGLDDADKVLGDVTVTAPQTAFNLPDEITYEGATLSLKSETTLSLYFKSEHTLTFTVDGKTVEPVLNGDYQVARIRGIPANELCESFELNISAENLSGSVTYSPMNYCSSVLIQAAATPDEPASNLENVIKALCLYAQAANDYFNDREG